MYCFIGVSLLVWDAAIVIIDMEDGGAAHFAQTVREIKSRYKF